MIGDGSKAMEHDPKALFGVSRCGEGAIGLLGAPDGSRRVLAIYCKGGEAFYKELNSRGERPPLSRSAARSAASSQRPSSRSGPPWMGSHGKRRTTGAMRADEMRSGR